MKLFLRNVLKKKIDISSFFSFLIILVLVTLPLKFIFNSISIALLFLSSVIYYLIKKPKLSVKSISKIIILLILIFVLSVFSLIWSIDYAQTISSLSNFLSFLLLPLCFYFLSGLEIKKTKILNIFTYTILLVSIYCLCSALINHFNEIKGAFYYHKLSGNFNQMNSIYLSVFTSFSILILFFKDKKSKFDYLFLILLSVFLVLLSSKTVTVITTTIIFGYIIFKKRNELNKKVLIFIILICALLSKNIVKRFELEFDKTNIKEVLTKKAFNWNYTWSGTSTRVLQSRIFYDIISNNRFFYGYGLNGSEKLVKKEHIKYKLYSKMIGLNFHNQYFQIMADLGVLGLFFLMLIFLYSFSQAINKKNFLFFSFLLLMIFVFFTESFLWRQRGMVFFITVLLILSKDNFGIKTNKNQNKIED